MTPRKQDVVSEIVKSLGITRVHVMRLARKEGMPLDSVKAARAWHRENKRPYFLSCRTIPTWKPEKLRLVRDLAKAMQEKRKRDFYPKSLPPLDSRVKLSSVGLGARGMLERGFGAGTRGTVVLPQGYFPAFVAVLVDGLEKPEHWGAQFWEVADPWS
jgi:hypothetical protein